MLHISSKCLGPCSKSIAFGCMKMEGMRERSGEGEVSMWGGRWFECLTCHTCAVIRSHMLQADSEQECQAWITALTDCISKAYRDTMHDHESLVSHLQLSVTRCLVLQNWSLFYLFVLTLERSFCSRKYWNLFEAVWLLGVEISVWFFLDSVSWSSAMSLHRNAELHFKWGHTPWWWNIELPSKN